MLLQIFKAILVTSAVGSVLAALLLLLKPITKRCFGSAWQYYAWAIVLIVMMLPVTIRIPQTVPDTVPNVSPNMQQTFTEATVQTKAANVQQTSITTVDTKLLGQSTINVLKDISFGITDMMCYAWMVGLMLILE